MALLCGTALQFSDMACRVVSFVAVCPPSHVYTRGGVF